MPVHLIDSTLFGGNWGTDETRALFDERARLQGWLDALAALAEAQAEHGVLPHDAAQEIRRVAAVDHLDLDRIRRGYERTGHSLQGLLDELGRLAEGGAEEWLCYGATVQDITDSWLSTALLQIWEIVVRELEAIEASLSTLAREHRATPMAGRTHGQPGLAITFGFKVAVWIEEIRRHGARLDEIRPRLGSGQLCGGVGTLSGQGEKALEVQRSFCVRLGLAPPEIAWTAARDVHAELLNLLALITATFDKIGHEIYNLARPEIGEVREGALPDAVGSITMPHKRNPEISEHLGTLAREVRHLAHSIAESLVHEHERDGRSWKLEWSAVPTACVLAAAQLDLARGLLTHLEVDADAMLRNLERSAGDLRSEALMLRLGREIGRESARRAVQRVAREASANGRSLREAAAADGDIRARLSPSDLDAIFDAPVPTGLATEFVDRVLVGGQARQPRGR